MLVRPEPGLSASAARARALGLQPICCPLFKVEAVDWTLPDAARFDALLLTSANAIRYGGANLSALRTLPVYAVGAATSEAAVGAGFVLAGTGSSDVRALLETIPDGLRVLHLAGEDRIDAGQPNVVPLTVYRSSIIDNPGLPDTDELVIAVHSPRAAKRLADLVERPEHASLVAISTAAAAAAGSGWCEIAIAERPTDDRLLALAAMLCHTMGQR